MSSLENKKQIIQKNYNINEDKRMINLRNLIASKQKKLPKLPDSSDTSDTALKIVYQHMSATKDKDKLEKLSTQLSNIIFHE